MIDPQKHRQAFSEVDCFLVVLSNNIKTVEYSVRMLRAHIIQLAELIVFLDFNSKLLCTFDSIGDTSIARKAL